MLVLPRVLLFLVFCSLVVPSPAACEDSNFSLDAGIGIFSDYIFRGLNLSDGTSIQPQVLSKYTPGDWGTMSAGVWSHLPGEGGQGGSNSFTEVDYAATYAIDVGATELTVGHIWYTFPGEEDLASTNEVFGSITVDTLLSPTIRFYHDYDEVDGQYYELAFAHEFGDGLLAEAPVTLTPYAVFGFASDSEEVYEQNGFVHATFGVLFCMFLPPVAVTPGFHYTAESDENVQNEFWFGTLVTWTF